MDAYDCFAVDFMAAEDMPMFDEEVVDQPDEPQNVPNYEGIPRRLLVTNFVTLHSIGGGPIVEGICHSISSNLNLNCNGPPVYSQVAIQISKTLDATEMPDEWRYFVIIGPIERVFCNEG